MRAVTGFGGKVKRPTEAEPRRAPGRSHNKKLDEIMPWPEEYFGIQNAESMRMSSPLTSAGEIGKSHRRTGTLKPPA
jgi:hypothetical protein